MDLFCGVVRASFKGNCSGWRFCFSKQRGKRCWKVNDEIVKIYFFFAPTVVLPIGVFILQFNKSERIKIYASLAWRIIGYKLMCFFPLNCLQFRTKFSVEMVNQSFRIGIKHSFEGCQNILFDVNEIKHGFRTRGYEKSNVSNRISSSSVIELCVPHS